MSFRLYASYSLEALAHRLSLNLVREPAGVFQPYYLVTQTAGMNNWLKSQLAKELGIAANLRFLKPNELIAEFYRDFGGSARQVLDAENLTWLLFSLLEKPSFTARFPKTAAYYNHFQSNKDLKRLGLAQKLADLFDQYQIYRPQMISAWNTASFTDVEPDEWQKYLWIALKEASRDVPDRSQISAFIKAQSTKAAALQQFKGKVNTITLFGISTITSYHLQVLEVLAGELDINFYILNPSPSDYWFDVKSEKLLAKWQQKGYDISHLETGNTLLGSWGKLISDSFSTLFQIEELINHYEEIDVPEPDAGTLLGKIQLDIHGNSAKEKHGKLTRANLDDQSIVINSCHTITREVEVLYNYLVNLIAVRKEALSSRDIVVMVTSIDKYAPYIRAIFAHAPYKFAFSIADESYRATDTLIHALETLLSIDSANFTAEGVLQLLDSGYIRTRFALNDIDKLRRAVNMAGIRFGLHGDVSDDTVFVSWTYGLQRIMCGICMVGDEAFEPGGEAGQSVYPLDLAEGSASHELIRFAHFVGVLMQSIQERERDRTIADWLLYTRSVLNHLVFETSMQTDDDYTLLDSRLSRIALESQHVSDRLSFEVFRQYLMGVMGSLAKSSQFAVGGITFCSLIPMRSIPFRVVAVLGLNFDDFPRKDIPVSFDLIQNERRRGDRNVKDNDKHLFLETLLSARSSLYLSYIGQSARDNSPIPPSALVDELVDYISEGCNECDSASVRERLVTAHKLHAFSDRYLEGDPRFYDYLHRTAAPVITRIKPASLNGSGNVLRRGNALPPELASLQDFQEIRLEKLIEFFKNPIKAYYNTVLNIRYEDGSLLLSDTEPFEVDALEAWKLKKELLHQGFAAVHRTKERLIRTGAFPLASMAEVEMLRINDEVYPVRELLSGCVASVPAGSVDVKISIGNSTLLGKVDDMYNDTLAFVSFSKHETKYLLEATLKYLALRASARDVKACFISVENKQAYAALGVSVQDAAGILEQYIDLYRLGHSEMLAFYPGFEFKPEHIDEGETEKIRKAITTRISKMLGKGKVSARDTYILTEFNRSSFDNQAAIERMIQQGRAILGPVVKTFSTYFS